MIVNLIYDRRLKQGKVSIFIKGQKYEYFYKNNEIKSSINKIILRESVFSLDSIFFEEEALRFKVKINGKKPFFLPLNDINSNNNFIRMYGNVLESNCFQNREVECLSGYKCILLETRGYQPSRDYYNIYGGTFEYFDAFYFLQLSEFSNNKGNVRLIMEYHNDILKIDDRGRVKEYFENGKVKKLKVKCETPKYYVRIEVIFLEYTIDEDITSGVSKIENKLYCSCPSTVEIFDANGSKVFRGLCKNAIVEKNRYI